MKHQNGRKAWISGAFLTAFLAFGGLGQVHAQAVGDTNFDISLEGIVVLHYYSSFDINLDSDALGNFLLGAAGDGSVDEGAAGTLTGFDVDLAITPSALTGNPASAPLILRNAWAVRSITTSGQTDISVSVPAAGATLTEAGSSDTISVTDADVGDNTAQANSTYTFNSPGLFSPQFGAVRLTLDMSNAQTVGDYTGGQFRLTAQAAP